MPASRHVCGLWGQTNAGAQAQRQARFADCAQAWHGTGPRTRRASSILATGMLVQVRCMHVSRPPLREALQQISSVSCGGRGRRQDGRGGQDRPARGPQPRVRAHEPWRCCRRHPRSRRQTRGRGRTCGPCARTGSPHPAERTPRRQRAVVSRAAGAPPPGQAADGRQRRTCSVLGGKYSNDQLTRFASWAAWSFWMIFIVAPLPQPPAAWGRPLRRARGAYQDRAQPWPGEAPKPPERTESGGQSVQADVWWDGKGRPRHGTLAAPASIAPAATTAKAGISTATAPVGLACRSQTSPAATAAQRGWRPTHARPPPRPRPALAPGLRSFSSALRVHPTTLHAFSHEPPAAPGAWKHAPVPSSALARCSTPPVCGVRSRAAHPRPPTPSTREGGAHHGPLDVGIGDVRVMAIYRHSHGTRQSSAKYPARLLFLLLVGFYVVSPHPPPCLRPPTNGRGVPWWHRPRSRTCSAGVAWCFCRDSTEILPYFSHVSAVHLPRVCRGSATVPPHSARGATLFCRGSAADRPPVY